jgi:Velvet factor
MTARLVTPDSSVRQPQLCDNEEDVLTGSVVSSLHRLKDVDNQGMFCRRERNLSPIVAKREKKTFFYFAFFAHPDGNTNPYFVISFLRPDAGFFVFGDLAIKIPGTFKIHFSLYEIRG